MGQADVAYMIQRIYEKYNATQNDKKYEERVYMGEDEFRYNLEEMVKKSPIEDKSLLYKEIYRNISENSLEIDSNGSITISPKLIIAVEKEIQMQQERDNGTIISEESKTEKKDFILDSLNIEAYESLSDKEKDDLFYDCAGWMFDSKEEATKAREDIEGIEIDTTVDAIEVSDNMYNGETCTEGVYKRLTGDDKIPDNKAFMQSRIDLKAFYQGMLEDDRLRLLFTQNNGKAKINMPFLNRIADLMNKTKEIKFDDIELIINNIYMAEKKKNPDVKKPTLEQIEGLRKLFQDKDKFIGTVRMLQLMGKMDKEGQAILRMDNPEMQQEMFAKMFQSKEIVRVFKSFVKEFKLELVPSVFLRTDNRYNDGNPGSVLNSVQFGDELVTQAFTFYENYMSTKLARQEAVGIDKKVIDEQIDRLTQKSIMSELQRNNITIEDIRKIVQLGIHIPEDVGQKQGDTHRVFADGTTDLFGGLKIDKATLEKILMMKKDDSFSLDKLYNPDAIGKKTPKIQDELSDGESVIRIVEDDIEISIDETSNPQNVNGKGNIDVETLDAVIDSSFGEITDGGVDMFDAMFAGMAEDLVFDGSTEVEHERDEEGEMEAGEDVPPVSAGTAPSGMVAEEVFVDETASKVNETTVPPVTNGPEVIEEPKAPEQSDTQPSLPKVITFADKIKKGLNDLGKKAKGIFGKIAGLFGGGNNDAGNNTGTTGTGGIAQDTKEPKSSQTPGQDFIQHVDLNFDYLKNNSTESRTDPIKPKGVDDQTQGFEVDDD